MKTRYKRIVASFCIGAMICSTLVGCEGAKTSENKVDNSVVDNTHLDIMIKSAGYGEEWLLAMADAFEKKEGVTISIHQAVTSDVISNDLRQGENAKMDLYFDISNTIQVTAENNKGNYKKGQALRDLTALYNTTIPGEDVTVLEKMNKSLAEIQKVEGRNTEDTSDDVYYSLPYITGTMGLFYNKTVIDNALGEGNWKEPNTTDEFIELCKRLKEKKCYILLPGGADTWSRSMFLAWWAQYEGIENFYKFYEGIGYDSVKKREVQNSYLIFEQLGRLASMETSYELLNYETGYAMPNAIEVGVNSLNEYQTRFTLSKYNYAFYPCGDWLLQELKTNSTVPSDSEIRMMKMPVISSIIDAKDGYSADNTKRLPNVKSDSVLSQVVDYVDGKGTLPAGVTEEEVLAIKEARNIMGTRADIHFVYASEASNSKELVDKFLLFMVSDEGLKIFKENCAGGFPPYDFVPEGLSDTEISVYEASKDAVLVAEFKYAELFYKGGVESVKGITADTLDGMLCKPKGLSAKEIINKFKESYSSETWQNYLSKFQ